MMPDAEEHDSHLQHTGKESPQENRNQDSNDEDPKDPAPNSLKINSNSDSPCLSRSAEPMSETKSTSQWTGTASPGDEQDCSKIAEQRLRQRTALDSTSGIDADAASRVRSGNGETKVDGSHTTMVKDVTKYSDNRPDVGLDDCVVELGRIDKSADASASSDATWDKTSVAVPVFGNSGVEKARFHSEIPHTESLAASDQRMLHGKARFHSKDTTDTDSRSSIGHLVMHRSKLASRRNAAISLEKDVAVVSGRYNRALNRSSRERKSKTRETSGGRLSKLFCCTSGSKSPPTSPYHPRGSKPRETGEITIKIRTRRAPLVSDPAASPLLKSPADVEIFENSMFSHEEEPSPNVLMIAESNATSAPGSPGRQCGAITDEDDHVDRLETEASVLEVSNVSEDLLSTKSDGETWRNIDVETRSFGDGAEAEGPKCVVEESAHPTSVMVSDDEASVMCLDGFSDRRTGVQSAVAPTLEDISEVEDSKDIYEENNDETAIVPAPEYAESATVANRDSMSTKTQQIQPPSNGVVSVKGVCDHACGNEYDISKIQLTEICSRFLQEVAKAGFVISREPKGDDETFKLQEKLIARDLSDESFGKADRVRDKFLPIQENSLDAENSHLGEDAECDGSPVHLKTTPRVEKVPSYIPYSEPKKHASRLSPRQNGVSTQHPRATSPVKSFLKSPTCKVAAQEPWSQRRSGLPEKAKVVRVSLEGEVRPFPERLDASFSDRLSSGVPPTSTLMRRQPSVWVQEPASWSRSSSDTRFASDRLPEGRLRKHGALSNERLPLGSNLPPCLTKRSAFPFDREEGFAKAHSTEDVSEMVVQLDSLASRYCSMTSIPTSDFDGISVPDPNSPWRGKRAYEGSRHTVDTGLATWTAWNTGPRFGSGLSRTVSGSVAEKIFSYERAILQNPLTKRNSFAGTTRNNDELGMMPPPFNSFEAVQLRIKSLENMHAQR